MASFPGFLLVLGGIALVLATRNDRVFERVFRPSAVRQYELQARLGNRYRYGLERHVGWTRRFMTGAGVFFAALGVVTIVVAVAR